MGAKGFYSVHKVFSLAVEPRTKLLLLAVLHEATGAGSLTGGPTRCGAFRIDIDFLIYKTRLPAQDVEAILLRLRAAGAVVPFRRPENCDRGSDSDGGGLFRVDLRRLPKQAPFHIEPLRVETVGNQADAR